MRHPLWLALMLAGCSRSVPFEPTEGSARYDYAPLRQVTTFPDAVHTVEDAATPTGRRVRFEGTAGETLRASMPEGFALVPALEDLDGFGTAGAISLVFTESIDTDSFVANTELWELDDDPRPLDWSVEWHDEDRYAIVHPLVPMQPTTLHGLVVRRGLLDIDGAEVDPSRALHDLTHAQSENEALVAVEPAWQDLLAAAEAEPAEVVAGTVFTTQSVTLHDDAITEAIQAAPPSLVPDGEGCVDQGEVRRCGMLLQGVNDFLGADRHLDVAYGDDPTVQRTYELAVDVYLPTEGDGPWPVVIYGHGLSGDRGEGNGAARRLFAPNGYATVSIDAPAHGEHPTATTTADLYWVFDFFGLTTDGGFDVITLRDSWRQATWDKLQLVEAMYGTAIDVDGDGTADLEGSQVNYSGHSLGGTMGPQLLAMDDRVGAADLSVPGGRVSDIVQFGQIFRPLVVGLAPDGTTDAEIASFFVMLQAAIERGDPINYASRVPNGERDLLVTMVLDDLIMPNRTTQALARAMGLQHAPVVHDDAGLEVLPSTPVSGNLEGRTAVFFEYDQELDGEQWVPAVHEHAHSNPVAVGQVGHFWATWAEHGTAEVVDAYGL